MTALEPCDKCTKAGFAVPYPKGRCWYHDPREPLPKRVPESHIARCGSCDAEIGKPVHTRQNMRTGEVQYICDNCLPPPAYFQRRAVFRAVLTLGVAGLLVVLGFAVWRIVPVPTSGVSTSCILGGSVLLILASALHSWYYVNAAVPPGASAPIFHPWGGLVAVVLNRLLLAGGLTMIWLASSFDRAFVAGAIYYFVLPLVMTPLLVAMELVPDWEDQERFRKYAGKGLW
jgi:hypothetical protein